jgi:hypothetical protein
MNKNFLFAKLNMVRADVFLRVLLRFLSARRSRAYGRGILAAACGGENGSRYFKNRAPFRKNQYLALASLALGCHFVFNLGLKNELAVSIGKRKNF